MELRATRTIKRRRPDDRLPLDCQTGDDHPLSPHLTAAGPVEGLFITFDRLITFDQRVSENFTIDPVTLGQIHHNLLKSPKFY